MTPPRMSSRPCRLRSLNSDRSFGQRIQDRLEWIVHLAECPAIQFERVVDFREGTSEPTSVRLEMHSDLIVQLFLLGEIFIDLGRIFPRLICPLFVRFEFREPIDARATREPVFD